MSVTEVIFVILLAYLAVIRVGGSLLDVIQVFRIFYVKVTLEITLNSFSKLKPFEGLVLRVVLLNYLSILTLSTGNTKAGVKKSLSALKVGVIVSTFSRDLIVSNSTSKLHGSPALSDPLHWLFYHFFSWSSSQALQNHHPSSY